MRTGAPKISVVMSVFNGGPWLSQAIESIRHQSFADFELIIVDDGSTDQTGQMVELAACGDARIRSVHQEHLGIGMALNHGIALARSPIIARMDGDDIAAPDRLRTQMAFLDAHPHVAALGSWAYVIGEQGQKIAELRPETEPSALRAHLSKHNPFVHSSMFLRADAVGMVGGYRPVLDGAEDYDLWLRLSEHAQLANVPEFLLGYRAHQTPPNTAAARKQLLAARLARLSAKARGASQPDFVERLDTPLNLAALLCRDELRLIAELYGLLGRSASDRFVIQDFRPLGSLDLDHGERKTAQFWLKELLRTQQSVAAHCAALYWLLRLHPPRGLSLMGSAVLGR